MGRAWDIRIDAVAPFPLGSPSIPQFVALTGKHAAAGRALWKPNSGSPLGQSYPVEFVPVMSAVVALLSSSADPHGRDRLPAPLVRRASWRISDPWRGLDPVRLLTEGTGRIVKTAPHRSVMEWGHDGQSYFVKFDRFHGLGRNLFRRWFRASPARREWLRAQELTARGVPTIEAVAYGEVRRFGLLIASFFISRAIPRSQTLEEWLATADRLTTKADHSGEGLAASLGRLCAACHEAGADHGDFHPGNILLEDHPAGLGWRPLVIDLPNVRLRARMDWPASRRSLASLFAGVRDRTALPHWRAFWQAYRTGRPSEAVPSPEEAFAELAIEAQRHAARIARSRDRRLLRTTQDYICDVLPGATLHRVRELPFEPIDAWAAAGCPTVDPSIERVEWPAEHPQAARQARAAWWSGHALLNRGIEVPRPLAVWLPKSPRSAPALLRERVDGPSLTDQCVALADDPESLAPLARAAGRTLGRMHRWRLVLGPDGADRLCLNRTAEHADCLGRADPGLVLVGWEAAQLDQLASDTLLEADLLDLAGRIAETGATGPWPRDLLAGYLDARDLPPGGWRPLARRVLQGLREKIGDNRGL